MQRFPQRGAADKAEAIELDAVFVGVDMRRPGTLGTTQAGLVTGAENVRFRNGDATTRPGCLMSENFNRADWYSILGAGIYSDPDGREWMLVATPLAVWMMADGFTPIRLEIPEPLEDVEAVEIVQTFNRVVMFRGKGKRAWKWSGDRYDAWKESKRGAPSRTSPSYLQPIPEAEFGVVMADRLFVPVSPDTVAWSDVLDFERFDPILAAARFNFGEDDAIVAMAPYQRQRLVVFKQQSIYVLENVGGAMTGIAIDRLATRVGCVARKSVVEVGNDLFFLGQGGVYRLSQTELDSLRTVAVPLSEPLRPVMERVNWGAADKACGVTVGGLYYLAIPLDGSTTNNAVLVYDLTTGSWQGLDYYGEAPPGVVGVLGELIYPGESAGTADAGALSIELASPMLAPRARTMLAADLFGERTAFMIDGLRVIALGHGEHDLLDGMQRPVVARIRSRGYHLDDLRTKSLTAIAPQMGELCARVSVALVTDGVNERQELVADRTRDRTRYRTHGKARFVIDNSGDDSGAAHREDYSWQAGDGVLMRSGIRLGQLQEWDQSLPVRLEGRWCAVEITAAGRISLKGLIAVGRRSREPGADRT